MKQCYFLVVAILAAFPLLADSPELCYRHYDKNSQPLSIRRKPPFDMSSPPVSPEYQAAKDRGEYVVISPSSTCSMPDKQTPSETVRNLGTASVPPTAYSSKSTQRAPSDPSTPVKAMTFEEYEEYRRQNPHRPLTNTYQPSPQPATPTYRPSPSVTNRNYSSPRRSGGGGKGCGSRGGPGYRLANGKCASWKD